MLRHMPEPFLRTARTAIRQIVESDYDEMMSVYGDLELMRFVGDSTAISPEDCRRWIDVTLNNYRQRSYGLFIVQDAETGKCIGFIGLTHPGGRAEPEIKYVLKKPYWGRGIAQEIVLALCIYAQETWNVGLIVATVDLDNEVSHRVLSKCGFIRAADIIEEDGGRTALWELHRIVQ